jgi:FdhD protein
MAKRIYDPNNYIVPPPNLDQGLCKALSGVDQDGETSDLFVINEKPLTLFLNAREIVTMMTIGDHPRLLALGFLANQAMLDKANPVTAVEHDGDLDVVVVRTARETSGARSWSCRTPRLHAHRRRDDEAKCGIDDR